MSKKIIDTKARTLIKAYLIFHRGKKCTAKEISEWINGNPFALNRSGVEPRMVARYIYAGRYSNNHVLNDVQMEKEHNLTYYWVN